jgi:hypothetical protein
MTKETTKAKGFDLAALDSGNACDKGAEIEIVDLENRSTGIFITVLGKDSQVFREHVKQDVNARIRREALASKRGKDVPPPTAEEAEAKATELLVICTLGWRQTVDTPEGEPEKSKATITYGNEELAFNVPNCKRIYETLLPVRRQIDDAIGDLENFI